MVRYFTTTPPPLPAFAVTFKNSQQFEMRITHSNTASLFKDGKPYANHEFSELMFDALYATCVCSIPAAVKNLEKHKEHLVRQREHELACAIIVTL
jgi:hypothetical protein